MEGVEQMAGFIKRKNDLEKQTEIQQSEINRLDEEVENLREELSHFHFARKVERIAALITLAKWGKEYIVDFMRCPP